MKNRLHLVILLIFVFFGAILLFFVLKYRKSKTETPINNLEIGVVKSMDVEPENYRSQYIAERLIRGSIKSYDQEKQVLNIAYQINPRAKEQIIAFPLTQKQVVYCWPQYNNGIDITQAFMPIDNQTIIYIQGEKAVTFKSIVDKVVGKYIFLQTDDQEQLVKLAIIACYE